MSNLPPFNPASVPDIVSFGYRRLFQHLKPLTLLASSFIMLAALVESWFFPELVQTQHQVSSNNLLDLFTAGSAGYTGASYGIVFLMILLLFSYLRYIHDVYTNTHEERLHNYLIPNRKLWGIVGFSLLLGLGAILGFVIMLMGMFLLVLPGLAALVGVVYLLVRISIILPAYIHHPEQGLGQALTESWQLTRGHFWRTLGMLVLVQIINFIIGLPFAIGGVMLAVYVTAVDLFWWPVVFVYYLLTYWAYYTVLTGGMTFVIYRHYFDLQVRRANNGELF